MRDARNWSGSASVCVTSSGSGIDRQIEGEGEPPTKELLEAELVDGDSGERDHDRSAHGEQLGRQPGRGAHGDREKEEA